MIKKLTFLACVVAVATFVQNAQASVLSFSQAELLGMTIDSESGVVGVSELMTPGSGLDKYSDDPVGTDVNDRFMRGAAGSTSTLDTGGSIFYTLSGQSLVDFIAAATAGDMVSVTGYNDNDDSWELGVWYSDGVTVTESSTLNTGEAETYSLALPASFTKVGVFVRNVGPRDTFHASWAAPEPGAVAIWALLGGMGLVSSRRRRA